MVLIGLERVELLCYPRVLGYSFNPLAIWYAYDKQGRLMALVAEVSNTFGQWHHYVLKLPETFCASTHGVIKAQAKKIFHVSPFIDMNAHYHFTVSNALPFGKDYAATLLHWRKQFEQHFHSLKSMGYDARFQRIWYYYLEYCRVGFDTLCTDVLQLTLTHKKTWCKND